jgi:xylulokinase
MFLGIDLGTSSVKVVLTDLSGKVWGEADSSYPVYGMEKGFFEQDPDDWTGSILTAVYTLRAKLPEELWQQVEAIGLSAQMPTMVLLGENGEILTRAIVWCDARAEAEGETLLDLWGKDRHYCKTGVKLDGRYIIPMYQWIRENKPELLEHPHQILSAKDYLYYWMCGKAVTDPSTASGFAVYNINKGEWDSELCSEAKIDIVCLPEVRDSEQGSMMLRETICKTFGLSREIPVFVGAADSVAGVLGLGAVEPGTVCQICGSSTAIIAISDKVIVDPADQFFITPLAKQGTFGFEADILSTGSASRWLSTLIGKDPAELSALAKKAPPGSDGVIFAPYLSGGEQSVLWDPALSGGILGLSFSHNASHIIRAHYEGICFEAKRCVEAFRRNGYEVKRILMSGPVTRDAFFMHLMADVLSIECIAAETDNASAYGAAILAGIGTGKLGWDFAAGKRSDQTSYEPYPPVSDQYAGYYKRYLAASAASKV